MLCQPGIRQLILSSLPAPRTLMANSRKYSNATFEEISHLVGEIVSLAETCCTDGADPSCYDAGVRLTRPG